MSETERLNERARDSKALESQGKTLAAPELVGHNAVNLEWYGMATSTFHSGRETEWSNCYGWNGTELISLFYIALFHLSLFIELKINKMIVTIIL